MADGLLECRAIARTKINRASGGVEVGKTSLFTLDFHPDMYRVIFLTCIKVFSKKHSPRSNHFYYSVRL